MAPDEYMKDRLQDQIDWHDRKSVENQRIFKRLRWFEIVAAALIPFASGLTASIDGWLIAGSVVTGLLGVAVTVLAGVIALGHHQENWINFRTTREELSKEKFLFETGVFPYKGDQAFPLLVHRVEAVLSRQHREWAEYTIKTDEVKLRGT